jgi:predicted DNA binding protein
MSTATGRSAAAKKANETRKRNKYEARRQEQIQSARRDYLYSKLTDEQREAIDAQLDSSTSCLTSAEWRIVHR